MFRSSLAVLLCVLAVAPAVMAQTHQEQITVNVIEVPVWVSSFGGRPVRNLRASDFELYVNGEQQPIEYFDVLVEKGAPTNAVETQQPERERPELHRRRLYLLLFDLTTLSMEYVQKAKNRAVQFVSEAPAGDTFAVATLRLDGIHFAVPFTTDRVAVERAVRTLRASMAGDAFNLATLETERARFGSATLARLPSIGEWDSPGVGPMIGFGQAGRGIENVAQKKIEEFEAAISDQLREHAIDNLSALADSLAPISGVKHVVVLSEGQPREKSALDGGLVKYTNYITRLHERYRMAGVTLNAVDVRPHIPGTGADGNVAADTGGLMRDPQMVLKNLAGGTGGVVSSNFKALREQHSVTYVLGFRPRSDQHRKESAIRVNVKNQPFGTYIRHRQAFSMEPTASKSGEGLFLADVLQNDIQQNGITVGVDVERQGEVVTLVASVPGREVLGYGIDGTTFMDVFLYVFDEQQVVAWWTHVRLRVDVEAGREYLSSHPYRIRHQMRLGPGRYAAKALLRVLGRDATGFQRTNFEIPKG